MSVEITMDNCDVLITAEEAFSAFEAAVLAAQSHIHAGFRVFDFLTTLQSAEACNIGETWFDLLAYKLDQGVRITLKLSDFDPIVGVDMHALTWRSLRQASALRELTNNPDLLDVKPSMHKARIGWLSNIGLWVKSRGMVAAQAEQYNLLDADARKAFRLERPGLIPFLQFDEAGFARARLWPSHQLVPATHHQKLAVIDGRYVYIGGLDLNDRRFDTKRHDKDPEETWHDVQLMIDDTELAQAAETHLREFDAVIAGEQVPSPLPRPFLRTLSTARANPVTTLSPRTKTRDIRKVHLEHIENSRDLIYLESQFLRDADITDALCHAARRASQLGLVVILPAAPEEVAFENASGSDQRYGEYLQAKCVDQLKAAFGPRVFLGTPVQPVRHTSQDRRSLKGAPVLYVHAKVSIFDDRAAIVSSANLNGRSLNWDTEAGVELTDPALVHHLKTRCVSHWLFQQEIEPYLGGPEAPHAWRALAHETADTQPEARKSFIVPYSAGPARRFGRNLPGVPEEMV